MIKNIGIETTDNHETKIDWALINMFLKLKKSSAAIWNWCIFSGYGGFYWVGFNYRFLAKAFECSDSTARRTIKRLTTKCGFTLRKGEKGEKWKYYILADPEKIYTIETIENDIKPFWRHNCGWSEGD